jgi:hypothetical protein
MVAVESRLDEGRAMKSAEQWAASLSTDSTLADDIKVIAAAMAEARDDGYRDGVAASVATIRTIAPEDRMIESIASAVRSLLTPTPGDPVVTAQMMKDLCERTGAGMSDCKEALDYYRGDMEAAAEDLRKRGQNGYRSPVKACPKCVPAPGEGEDCSHPDIAIREGIVSCRRCGEVAVASAASEPSDAE